MNRQVMDEFFQAVESNDSQKVKVYLNMGISPNSHLDRAEIRPLHVAVAYKAFKTAKLLLAAGADPLVEDEEGETPLDLAKACQYEKMIRLFERDSKNFFNKLWR